MDSVEEEVIEQENLSTDRLLAFSDGVFAIAITLLVLDIHVPQLTCNTAGMCAENLWIALGKQWPRILSFLFSFLIIGVIWAGHHATFSYIKRSNHMLIVFNLLLLLDVVLLPFAAALLASYLGTNQQSVAVTVYSGLLLMGGLIYNGLWWYASSDHRLIDKSLDSLVIKQVTRRYLAGPFLYGVAFLLSFFWNGTPGLVVCTLLAAVYLLPPVVDHVNLNTRASRRRIRNQQEKPVPSQK